MKPGQSEISSVSSPDTVLTMDSPKATPTSRSWDARAISNSTRRDTGQESPSYRTNTLANYRRMAQSWLRQTGYKLREPEEVGYAACIRKYEAADAELRTLAANSRVADPLMEELNQVLREIELDLMQISEEVRHLDFSFEGDGDFVRKLRRTLGAYALRSLADTAERAVGYYRGMHLICMLLLKLYPESEEAAFQVLCVLVEDVFTAGYPPYPNLRTALQFSADHEVASLLQRRV